MSMDEAINSLKNNAELVDKVRHAGENNVGDAELGEIAGAIAKEFVSTGLDKILLDRVVGDLLVTAGVDPGSKDGTKLIAAIKEKLPKSEVQQQRQQDEPLSHLDLIKGGMFQLKKVVPKTSQEESQKKTAKEKANQAIEKLKLDLNNLEERVKKIDSSDYNKELYENTLKEIREEADDIITSNIPDELTEEGYEEIQGKIDTVMKDIKEVIGNMGKEKGIVAMSLMHLTNSITSRRIYAAVKSSRIYAAPESSSSSTNNDW
jgi:hypothetical protein